MRSIDEFEMDLGRGEKTMRKRRTKPVVVGQRTELRDGLQFNLSVPEPATRDYLLHVDGPKHFPPQTG